MSLPENLGTLGVDPDVIAQVVAMLDRSESDLGQMEVRTTGQGRFGGSPTGHQLSGDALGAHDVALAAIQSMATSLGEYIEYLSHWQSGVEETDAASAADLLAFDDAVSAVSTPHLGQDG